MSRFKLLDRLRGSVLAGSVGTSASEDKLLSSRASGCTSTLRSPASVVLVVSALAATGCVSKPTLEMFQAASPYVVATARVASQGHPG